jgi:hypothetical protein
MSSSKNTESEENPTSARTQRNTYTCKGLQNKRNTPPHTHTAKRMRMRIWGGDILGESAEPDVMKANK